MYRSRSITCSHRSIASTGPDAVNTAVAAPAAAVADVSYDRSVRGRSDQLIPGRDVPDALVWARRLETAGGRWVASRDVGGRHTVDRICANSPKRSRSRTFSRTIGRCRICSISPTTWTRTRSSPTAAAPSAPRSSSIVRARGERETDVRLLVDNGERYLTLANDLANTLRCDVYLTPHGAERATCTSRNADHRATPGRRSAIDTDTGEPVEWLVVRPLGLPEQRRHLVHQRPRPAAARATAWSRCRCPTASPSPPRPPTATPPTWPRASCRAPTHHHARGQRRARPVRDHPVRRRRLAAGRRRVRHPGRGQPRRDPPRRAGRPDLAHRRGPCASLNTELMRLADGLNRTVWVPQPQGAAFVLPGFGEFVAVDEVGAPVAVAGLPVRDWTRTGSRPTAPTSTAGWRRSARSPAAGSRRCPFVSVPAAPARTPAPLVRAAIAPCAGLFPIDLAVLPDGRLGVLLKRRHPGRHRAARAAGAAARGRLGRRGPAAAGPAAGRGVEQARSTTPAAWSTG